MPNAPEGQPEMVGCIDMHDRIYVDKGDATERDLYGGAVSVEFNYLGPPGSGGTVHTVEIEARGVRELITALEKKLAESEADYESIMTDSPLMRQPKTLIDRAGAWFGASNTAKMRTVPLGRGRVAFVGSKGRRLWIYQEDGGDRKTFMVVNLTDKMRDELIDALEGF